MEAFGREPAGLYDIKQQRDSLQRRTSTVLHSTVQSHYRSIYTLASFTTTRYLDITSIMNNMVGTLLRRDRRISMSMVGSQRRQPQRQQLQQYTVRLMSMNGVLKKQPPTGIPKQNVVRPQRPKAIIPDKNHRSKIVSSNKLHDALQQNLLSSTSFVSNAGTSAATSAETATSTTTRPSMTTSQLAMSKYGNGSASSSSSSSFSLPPPPPPPHYISVQDRQRKNQQAIINVIFSFSLVLLACQTFKSGIEKRRIQQQYQHTKDTLQQTQATIQQYIFPTTTTTSTTNTNDTESCSPELLHIATLILQQQQQQQKQRKDGIRRRDRMETIVKSSSWFHSAHRGGNLSVQQVEDEIDQLLVGGDTTATTPEQQQEQQMVALIIQKQLQILLRDIAFDEYQKESLQVQALAASASSSTPSHSQSVSGPTTHPHHHHVANYSHTTHHKNDNGDDSMALMEQLLLESLQLENNDAAPIASNRPSTESTTTTTSHHDTHRTVDVAETNASTSDVPEHKNVVKKRLFSI